MPHPVYDRRGRYVGEVEVNHATDPSSCLGALLFVVLIIFGILFGIAYSLSWAYGKIYGIWWSFRETKDLQITQVGRFQEGDRIFLRLLFTDQNNNAIGYGFKYIRDGRAEEHPFSDLSYRHVSPGKVEYPLAPACGKEAHPDWDAQVWVYDSNGRHSSPVTIIVRCLRADKLPSLSIESSPSAIQNPATEFYGTSSPPRMQQPATESYSRDRAAADGAAIQNYKPKGADSSLHETTAPAARTWLAGFAIPGSDTSLLQVNGHTVKLNGVIGMGSQYVIQLRAFFAEHGNRVTCKPDNDVAFTCYLGKIDIGHVVVRNGAGRAEGSRYLQEEERAQEEQRGIWGGQ